jgi:hypothetical protein
VRLILAPPFLKVQEVKDNGIRGNASPKQKQSQVCEES